MIFSLSAANRDFFRFPRYIAIILAWTLTNRYRFWQNGTKLGQMSYRPIGNVIVISLDIWCQALISTKRQKSTNALLMCTVHWHFQRLVQPLVCQQFYLLNHARFRHFFRDFLAFVPRIHSNFCRDKTASLSLRILLVTVPRFLTSFTAMNKHPRREQSGDWSKDFRYTSRLILWLFDNKSGTLPYDSMWNRSSYSCIASLIDRNTFRVQRLMARHCNKVHF